MMVEMRCATMTTAASATTGYERGAEPGVGREVERGERVVEQVDVGPLHQRAGDGETLALPARDVGAALRDRRVEPAGHRGDEVARLRDLECLPQLVVGGVGAAEPEVARDRAREQVRPLRHEPDVAPEQLRVDVADVDAVHQHRASGGVVEPRAEAEQRRLARAGAPHHRERLAGGRPGTRCR